MIATDPITSTRWRRESEMQRATRSITDADIGGLISNAELDEIAKFWLELAGAAADGDAEAEELLNGTFGPWASKLFASRAH